MNRNRLDRQEMADLEDLAALLHRVISDLELLRLHAKNGHILQVIGESLAMAQQSQAMVHKRRRYLDRAACLAGKLQTLAMRQHDDPTNLALIDEMLVLLGQRGTTNGVDL